ncbi:MAG: L-histidine N(alpha)-methyltransferase [Verrucomicrobiota bacterium]
MAEVAKIAVHPSQFPEAVRQDLLASLASRRINHKFHYDSIKQTQRWLALHQIYSPSRNDEDCAATYDRSFQAMAALLAGQRIHLIGLGCGGGQKDTRLVKCLNGSAREIYYSPCDVSTAMVLTAQSAAQSATPNCFPLVCDFAAAPDLAEYFQSRTPPQAVRVLTFFGMIPNFEPEVILPWLVSLLRPRDFLLFSANLAPGADYDAGMKAILPQYDNPPTRDWLMTFLLDLGVERGDGELRFGIPDGDAGLKRVTAEFHFLKTRRLEIDGHRFNFCAGDFVRLFFSYRYTPDRTRDLLARHGLSILNQWVAHSEEEGVFLCQRT